MFSIASFLAEIAPQSGMFLDYSRPPQGTVLAGLFFMLILIAGVVIDFGLTVYFIKRPPRLAAWHETLRGRALSGRMVLVAVLILIAMYAACSLSYAALFPDVHEPEPHTLIFQGLFFNLPASLVMVGLFIHHRIKAQCPAAMPLRRTPALLGLSVVLYLAAIPLLWFYSLLYQLFLYQLGFDFHLQAVAQIFLAPATPLMRAGMFFTAIILAPAFEELLFRGILLPWTVRRIGFWPGIAVISVVFAGMHFHLPSMLPLFMLSVFFCVVYSRTRSLLVPIGMHACFNAVTVILLLLTGGG